MIIKSVRGQNFLILGEFYLDLQNKGLTLIRGENLDDATSNSNGAGKTAIMTSIFWCLFGDTIRGVKSADSVVNNKAEKDCFVSVEFEDSGIEYKVTRYRKHTKHKNKLILLINGKDSRGKDKSDTQSFIEEILAIDKNAFVNSVLFGQGNSKTLKRFSEMGDAERKECIERILNIEVYSQAHANAKSKIRIIFNELEDFEVRLRRYKLDVKELESEHLKFSQKSNQFVENKLNSINSAVDELTANQAEKVKLEKELDELEEPDLEALREIVSDCEDKLARIESKRATGTLKYNAEKRDKQVALQLVQKDVSDFNSRANRLGVGATAGEECPYCTSEINAEAIAARKTTYEESAAELREFEGVLVRELKEFKDKFGQFIYKVEDKRLRLKTLQTKARAAIQNGMALRTDKVRMQTSLEALVEKITYLETRLTEISSEENPYTDQLETIESKLTQLSSGIDAAEEVVLEKKEELKYLRFWENGFSRSGVRSYLLDKIVPYLNSRLDHYLTILTDGGICAKFQTQKQLASGDWREAFELAVINKNAAQDYAGNSGGEKRRIDLAVSLAINDFLASRSSKRFNILLLDEVFEGVDAEGLFYVIKVLEDIGRRKSSVFVVTHREELSSYFTNEVRLVRKDGMSHLVH